MIAAVVSLAVGLWTASGFPAARCVSPWRPPVPGPVVRPFAPSGAYGGHWGVDLAAADGAAVTAVADGIVSFAGTVAGNLTVTVDHGGLRSSYSYLASVTVGRGDRVAAGALVGTAEGHGGSAGVHLSARLGDRYVDPVPLLGCLGPPSAGLWLLPVTAPVSVATATPWVVSGLGPVGVAMGEPASRPYPRGHARHPRRNLRSSSRGPPGGCRGGVPPARPRDGDVRSGGCAVAEGRT